MAYENYNVIDCDGHIVESVPEMAEYMSRGSNNTQRGRRAIATANGRRIRCVIKKSN